MIALSEYIIYSFQLSTVKKDVFKEVVHNFDRHFNLSVHKAEVKESMNEKVKDKAKKIIFKWGIDL